MAEVTNKKNVYIIIGEGKCGKSSLVRALTGIYRSGLWWVDLMTGDHLHIKIWSQSRQEANKTPEETLSQINNDSAINILITLRFEPAPQMSPHMAQEYYDLISANHDIVQVIFMGPEKVLRTFETLPKSEEINSCWDLSTNGNAAKVRKWWGWQ